MRSTNARDKLPQTSVESFRRKQSIALIGPDNPFCSGSDTRFRQTGEKVAGPLLATKSGFCQSDQARYFALIGLAGSLSRKILSSSTRKFQHEETLRGSEIKFDVTRSHAWVLRYIGAPVTWHCVAVCIELRLNVSQTLDGLSGPVVSLQTPAAASAH